MVKYLIKRKMKNQVEKKDRRALIYAGGILVGVGGYFAYKAIKNRNMCCESSCCDDYYCEDDCCDDDSCCCDDYDTNAYCCSEEDENYDDLKCKVDEFNSNRITSDNSIDADRQELEGHVNRAVEEREYEEREENKYRPGVGINYHETRH